MEKRYLSWLEHEGNASMSYLGNNVDQRLDPQRLLPGVKSIISVAISYAPHETFPEGELRLAAYALGQDYHDVVKERLRLLAEAIGAEGYRAFCDSAPVLERYWAERGGIGWIGRNRQLIIPKAGSMFFLGELFILEEVSGYDSPCKNHCGNCTKCVEACPTNCLGNECFKAEKCLSYQTIENRGELSEDAKGKMGDMFYGCDRCLAACPWNKKASPTEIKEFFPNAELMRMRREDWRSLTIERYRELFRGSAVKRAKYAGLKRNIDSVLSSEEKEKNP